MERMGPEALMVRARTAPRVAAAEYARAEYPYEDIRVVAARLRADLDDGMAGPSALGGLVLRAQAWLRGGAERDLPEWAREAPASALAALPAAESGVAPEGPPAPVWAIPVLARKVPEPSR
jgi:hypothetical protein